MPQEVNVKELADKIHVIVKKCGDICEEEGLPREIGHLAALYIFGSMIKMLELHIPIEAINNEVQD